MTFIHLFSNEKEYFVIKDYNPIPIVFSGISFRKFIKPVTNVCRVRGDLLIAQIKTSEYSHRVIEKEEKSSSQLTAKMVESYISYIGDIANASSFGCLNKIKWQGPVFKLICKELLVYIALHDGELDLQGDTVKED